MNFEALPIEVKESAMTDAQKKVLNVLYSLNTLDKTKENGYFFLTNKQLKKEAQISSNDTLNKGVIPFLISNNFINRTPGKQCPNGGVASTYVLNTEIIMNWSKANKKMNKENRKKLKKLEDIKAKIKMGTPNEKMGTPNEKMGTPNEKMGTPNEKCTDVRCTDIFMLELKAIRQENKELKQMLEYVISQIKMGTLEMGTPNEKMGTLDKRWTTDIDIEIDKEIKENNIYDHTTGGPVEKIKEINTSIEDTATNKENNLNSFNFEVCDSDEQREEEKTNGYNETKSAVEVRSNKTIIPTEENTTNTNVEQSDKKKEHTSIEDTHNTNEGIITLRNFNFEDRENEMNEERMNEVNDNNETITEEQTITSTDGDINNKPSSIEVLDYDINNISSTDIINTPEKSTPTPRNEENNKEKIDDMNENANKAVLSHENAQDDKVINSDNKTQQEANKVANLGCFNNENEFKNAVREEYRRIIKTIKGNYSPQGIAEEMDAYFDFCRNCDDWNLCVWWYDSLEHIIKKFRNWYDNGDLDNAIYSIANSIMDSKQANSH